MFVSETLSEEQTKAREERKEIGIPAALHVRDYHFRVHASNLRLGRQAQLVKRPYLEIRLQIYGL
jgi:hypothetical protein